MLDLAQGVRAQIIKETKPKAPSPHAFTMRRLRYAALWGACAAGALFVAVLSSRGGVGAERLAAALHGDWLHSSTARLNPPTPIAAAQADAQAETRRLAEAVRSLTASNEDLKSRVAVVEHDVDDVTGSISKQIAAADAARHVEDGPTVLATANAAPAVPLASPPWRLTGGAPATTLPSLENTGAPVVPPAIAYGVDIGSGVTIEALRARWLAIRKAHPQLFEGLEPIVSIKDVSRANRVELRLVAGPFDQASAAEQLCASLTALRLFCQPTMYDGQHLALR